MVANLRCNLSTCSAPMLSYLLCLMLHQHRSWQHIGQSLHFAWEGPKVSCWMCLICMLFAAATAPCEDDLEIGGGGREGGEWRALGRGGGGGLGGEAL